MKYKAFLFDLNGTMIDDMPFHVRAWHRILNEQGANLTVEEARQECYGKNQELIERVLPGRFTQKEKDRMSIEKETQYQREFKPHLRLIPGLDRFLYESRQKGIRLAIGTAAIRYNIDFVLDNLGIRELFEVIVTADEVFRSKPDPETYIRCRDELGLRSEDCLVFEDSPKGVETALNAGMDTVVITTLHRKEEFDGFNNIIRFIGDYDKFELP